MQKKRTKAIHTSVHFVVEVIHSSFSCHLKVLGIHSRLTVHVRFLPVPKVEGTTIVAFCLVCFPGTRKMMNRLTVLAALTPSCFVYSKHGSAGVLPRIECHTRTHGVIFLFRPRPVHRCRGRLSVFLFFSFLLFFFRLARRKMVPFAPHLDDDGYGSIDFLTTCLVDDV